MTLAVYDLIKAGGYSKGGTNFDAKLRRASTDTKDFFHGYITGMDTMALAYKIAATIIEDGRLDNFVAKRYSSYNLGIGKRIVHGTVSFEALEKHALDLGEITNKKSGAQEYLEGLINSITFG